MILVGGLRVLVGSFGGFNQLDMRQLMAYSSIVNLG